MKGLSSRDSSSLRLKTERASPTASCRRRSARPSCSKSSLLSRLTVVVYLSVSRNRRRFMISARATPTPSCASGPNLSAPATLALSPSSRSSTTSTTSTLSAARSPSSAFSRRSSLKKNGRAIFVQPGMPPMLSWQNSPISPRQAA